MDPSFRARLERVYSEHPQTADAVLRRVLQERTTLDGLSARDLAEASGGGPTDQNHAGGAAAVRALAAAVGVAPHWRVLDVGTGLGGTPRLLAEEWHCRCHGVELTEARFRDAVRLTQLVGLDGLVTFTLGDFMEVEVPGRPYDLGICQGALMHFPDVPAALRRFGDCLRAGGRLAIEDAVVAASPSTDEARASLRRLLQCWNGELQRREDWPEMLATAGFRVDRIDDLTVVAVRDFETLVQEDRADRFGLVSDEEREGWHLALQFLKSGHLASVRILATRTPAGAGDLRMRQ